MSALNPSPLGSDDSETADAWFATVREYTPSPPATLRTLSFWLAVVLPFLYVPLLASGITSSGERGALAIMLALNVVALYGGHDHHPE